MSRGPLTFKKTDVARAVKALMTAGLGVERVEIDKGEKITVVAGRSTATVAERAPEQNEWDDEP